ncbi:S41 family peptidase [Patescibacteria group bacterium]|nr:S41 family peptidase [Patescibacteria group bacterium]
MKKIGAKKIVLFGGAVLIVVLVFVAGIYTGIGQQPAIEKITSVFNKEEAIPTGDPVDFDPFWKTWRVIEEKYVSNDGLDRQEMVWGAISGLAKSLDDPYTTFFPPEEKKLFESEIRGNFEGVGMEIGMRKGLLTIIAPLKDTPAYRAGVKAGDRILKIDDESTAEITLTEAVRRIRGKKGTDVTLTVLRNDEDETREITITRDVIKIPTLETEVKEDGIFIIRLFNFSERSPSVFRKALREMAESQSNKLILDLRNNPGGFLEAAVDIASWFLPTGKVVVKEDFGRGKEVIYRSRGYNALDGIAVVVLVNGGSASASEIVAGALKEHGIATIVGTKTFGKGSVQELVSITRETSFKVTIARWLTPNGRSISEDGLEPDIVVEVSGDEEEGTDPQLEKAIEILKELPKNE